MFESAFESVSPTKIGIDLKSSTKSEEQPQQRVPPPPPKLSPQPVKRNPTDIIEDIEKGDLSPTEAINQLVKDKTVTSSLKEQIQGMWAVYYNALALKPGAKKYRATAGELLNRLEITDPMLEKLKDLISLYPGLSDIEIFEIQTWKDKGIEMFAESNGDL